MATKEFEQREEFYYRARSCAKGLLEHPDFEAPEHPYINDFDSMIDYAAMGVLDTNNGVLHTGDTVFNDSVVIVPMLPRDVGRSKRLPEEYTCADDMCAGVDSQLGHEASLLKKSSAICTMNNLLLNPVIGLSPNLMLRDDLTLGAAVIHELDHAYLWWHRDDMFRHGGIDSRTGRAKMEISAYRLEQQLYFAHEPDLYDEEYGKVSIRFAGGDFSKEYLPKSVDRKVRNARSTAFTNFLFDTIGAEIGVRPSPKIIKTMEAQQLI